jgi:hypothetical protein
MRDKTPQGHPVGFPPSWPSACTERWQEPLGLPKFFDISLPACHGLRTPADRHNLAKSVALMLPSGALKPSASAIAMSKLYQHFRVRGHPYGLQDALSTLRPSCSPGSRPRLRHGRKTRYGWVASPYPTGTFTLQETPSLSWRDNAGLRCRVRPLASMPTVPSTTKKVARCRTLLLRVASSPWVKACQTFPSFSSLVGGPVG